MAFFLTSIDIANRAAQHLGVPRISSFTGSKFAREAGFAYDKLRRSELRHSVWTFAIKRAVLRAVTSTSKIVDFPAWSSGGTYQPGDVVADSDSYVWLAYVANTTVSIPGASTAWLSYFGPFVAQAWSASVQYIPGDVVYVSTAPYLAVAPSLNHTPPNATYWHPFQSATLEAIFFPTLFPIGYDPDSILQRRFYRLPANYLRMAAQDPKNAAGVQLDVTGGMRYNDWTLESAYIITNDVDPIVFRFVADQANVPTMDDLFCEVLAARIAVELCETMTQSADKLDHVTNLYNHYKTIARTTSSIEGGSSEDEPSDMPAQPGAR